MIPVNFKNVSVLTLLCVFATISIIDNGEWMLNRSLWYLLGLQHVPASAVYYFRLENKASIDLQVNVTVINDRKFEVMTPRQHFNRMKMGRTNYTETILRPNESVIVDIPSQRNPKIGLLSITAISDMQEEKSSLASQRFFHEFYRWQDLTAGVDENGSPRACVSIDDQDLMELRADSLKSTLDELNCGSATPPATP